MNSQEPVTNRAEPLLLAWEKRLASGEIDEAEWYRGIAAEITPAYLSGENPRTQSGFDGSEDHWIQARSLIADAIDRSGTFLDVGCANAYLMECLERLLRFKEKGGKEKELPVHHKLEELLDHYLKTTGLEKEPESPLFPAALGRKTGKLSRWRLKRTDAADVTEETLRGLP